ncbi:MAG: hypothetical protein V7641_3301, partial [Blastocatellia bacterium]
MNMKRAVMIAVLVLAVAALAVPLMGLKTRAAGSAADARASLTATKANAAAVTGAAATAQPNVVAPTGVSQTSDGGKISAETLKSLGIRRVPKAKLGLAQAKAAQQIASNIGGKITPLPANHRVTVTSPQTKTEGPPLIGEPLVLNQNSALSAALITTIGGRDTQFSEVALISDWDGREDCVADRGVKIDDFSSVEPDIDFSLTRAAISEHTRGNGHPFFNVYYYGDSLGNAYSGVDVAGNALVDILFSINIPELVNTGTSNGFVLLNPTAGDCTDDQVTVTGIAVNPVADLGDFSVPGANLCGVTGEVIYVSVFDSQGCASNGANQPIRTRIFAYGIFEGSDAGGGFVAFTNVRQILRSKFANTAGLAVDDDGSLYYQLVDLIQFTGGAIFKATEITRTRTCGPIGDGTDGGPGVQTGIFRVIPGPINDPPTLNSWLTNGTANLSGGARNTNYGRGSSTLYGNVVSLATGACNTLYAAVSRSFVDGPVSFEQLTEGLFPAPSAFGAAGTPSMVISFAD